MYQSRSMLASVFLCLLLMMRMGTLYAQVNIQNFSRNDYLAGAQNWTFQQDDRGNLYVANNEGLLTYNGIKWKVYPIPNQTIVRFICFGGDGKLYAGGQDEIGYFAPDLSGRLKYTSLVELIEKNDRQFADVWNIVPFGKDVFFRSSSKLFWLHNNQIKSFHSSIKWDFLGIHNNQLIAHDLQKGLLKFNGTEWEDFLPAALLPRNLGITSICSFQNGSVLTTVQNGLLKLVGNELVPFLIKGQGFNNEQYFTCAEPIGQGRLLLGTYENGIYLIDSNAQIISTYSKAEGLNNNNIKSIFKDNFENIWLGLEDGISFLNLNSSIKWFNPKIFNGAAGYSATFQSGKIYFAMANGIYAMPLEPNEKLETEGNSIKKITSGLSWNITNIAGRLFAGRDDGSFEVKEDQLNPIDQSTGYWLFKPLFSKADSMIFAAGNYQGISFFKKSNNNYTKIKDLSYLNTSSRFLEYDSILNAIWISHPYRGVYKISLRDYSVNLFTEKEGLPSTLNNHIFKINNRPLVASTNGIYEYDAGTNRFKVSSAYDTVFKKMGLRYLKEDLSGNLWFVQDKSIGIFLKQEKALVYLPELKRRILSGFEHIFPIDQQNLLVGAEQGFFLVNIDQYLQNRKTPTAYIRTVTVKSKPDSVLFEGFGSINNEDPIKLNHQSNSFHFEFSTPFSSNSGGIQFSWRLRRFDKEWSEWSEKTEKDYTNIPAGDYVFEVRVQNNLKESSSIASFPFEILPPWYSTAWAKFLYVLLLLGLLYLLYKQQEKTIHKRQEKKMEEERKMNEEKQRMLSYQHQLELEKSEKELIQLKNEKLESELASTAMNLVQKKEFILRIKDEISKLNKTSRENIDSSELKKILKRLTAEDSLDEEWEQFSIHFNKVHGDFLTNLKTKYPELKAHELKLCAYLRLNLSSKEIAQLMSISVRGVEISRYRLRKKLMVPAKEDLFQFLFSLDKQPNQSDTREQKD